MKRLKIVIKGIVQGVGFRPFIYRSAAQFGLTGFVKNSPQGVIIEVEGKKVHDFVDYVTKNPPPLSHIQSQDIEEIPIQNSDAFVILQSEKTGTNKMLISPDIAICEDCKRELFDPTDRRHQYPFINCTNCGPRFTIIQDIPYDRPKTTMKVFPMCDACRKEYENPLDRRYHAQPVACFDCGPTLDREIEFIAEKLRAGAIIAVKGLGGYHLACIAEKNEPIQRLRLLKNRGNKPFALMGTIKMIEKNCFLSQREREFLLSPSAPIMLLRKKETSKLSDRVAPNQNYIGFMIPYTPLHLLLLGKIGQPLVMTSANQSDEPIIYQDNSAELRKLSDYILSHNRKIHIFADDSVARVFDDEIYILRRSRGFVPFPIEMPLKTDTTILGIGTMMKTTFTFYYENKAIMSQYIGSTDSPKSLEAERESIQHFMKIFDLEPEIVAIDKHPNYPNRMLVKDFPEAKIIEVQHHEAHVASLLAEKQELGKILGISMDGTGYGDDGKIWGGEFFVGDYQKIERIGHLRYVFLPSGDTSVKEPWRFALSLLYSCYGESDRVTQFAEKFGEKGNILLQAIKSNIGGVGTSSCGRLFDGITSIMGIKDYSSYDGELPSILQAYGEKFPNHSLTNFYNNFSIKQEKNIYILDFIPIINDIINERKTIEEKAFKFHSSLAQGILRMAEIARKKYDINKVGLIGGVFQNILLLKLTVHLLREKGFEVLFHSKIPTNDGGISLGQAFWAAAK